MNHHEAWNRIQSNQLVADGIRFLLAGGLNTLLSILVYQLLLLFLSPGLSYALCWLVGLVFLLVVYPSKVFVGSGTNTQRMATTVAVYAVVFGISYFCLQALVAHGVPPRLAIFGVLVISTATNFLLMRLIYRGIAKNGQL